MYKPLDVTHSAHICITQYARN